MEKQFIENDLKNFDSLINSTKNQLVEMAIADDKIPVGYTCSYIPQELLSIGNLFPLRLLVPEIESTENAELYLPSTLCSYCKSLLEFAMTEEYPHQIRGWVFTSSCQHMARLYDNLRHINKEIFTFMAKPFKL